MVRNWKIIQLCIYIECYMDFFISPPISTWDVHISPRTLAWEPDIGSTVDMWCDMKKSISYCVYHIFQECTEVWCKFSGVWYKLQGCDMSHDDKDKNKQRYDTGFRGVVRAVKSWQVIQAMHFTSDLASARHFCRWRLIFESDWYFLYPIRHLNF
jgi:hypothetical protein